MNTNSPDYLREIATDLDRPAAEREAARTELATRIAEIKSDLDLANHGIRNAMKNDAPEAEQYHRNRRTVLVAALDHALGF